MNRPDAINPSTPVTERAADALNHAAAQGGDAVRQLVATAGDLTQRSADQLRGQAEAGRDGTVEHIRSHPMRSVLIATGTGVALALLLGRLAR